MNRLMWTQHSLDSVLMHLDWRVNRNEETHRKKFMISNNMHIVPECPSLGTTCKTVLQLATLFSSVIPKSWTAFRRSLSSPD